MQDNALLTLAPGMCVARDEGTPQGGPPAQELKAHFSPLLANLLLDDRDQLLESRGHRFCRYADDSNIYVRSLAAGQRVMNSVTRLLEGKRKLRERGDIQAARSLLHQVIAASDKIGLAMYARLARQRLAQS